MILDIALLTSHDTSHDTTMTTSHTEGFQR